MAVLEARNISFSYKSEGRRVEVLKNVSLCIEPGDFVAIQGSSGSGKSTLLYILGCMLKPDQGELWIDGEEVTGLDRDSQAYVRNQTLGFVFQQFHLLQRATVLDNILLPTQYPCETATPSPAHRQKAVALAEKLGLAAHLEHLPNQLSGGQQQRVAIARALMNDVKIILADEPTGNLDTKNAAQIMELLKELNRQGTTILVITHDPEVAKNCSKTLLMRDGAFVGAPESAQLPRMPQTTQPRTRRTRPFPVGLSKLKTYAKITWTLLPLAWENLVRHKGRSLLTMLGITIGIASVLAMMTLGQFTKSQILQTYEALGVNKLEINGYPNWNLKAVDRVQLSFKAFDWEKDILPLKKIFPELALGSPVLHAWKNEAHFGGRSISDGVRLFGVNNQYLKIMNHDLVLGSNFSPFHMENRSGVCIIGYEIAQRLFSNTPPLGQMLNVSTGEDPLANTCRIIGVLASKTSNSEWFKPNTQILVPYTFFTQVTKNYWDSLIFDVVLQLKPDSDIEAAAKKIKAFFQQKYGKSGRFHADSDDVLVAQMKKFLGIFAILLASIAFISLLVGGIGITNMMLVSVSERYKEIGLRKALGATDLSIRAQFLIETTGLCFIAGVVGMVLGFVAYESLIYAASRFVSYIHFDWILNVNAFLISFTSIILVGIGSGLLPAIRAEKLEVIEALRTE